MPVISTNTAANTAVRYLNINSSDQSESLAKLASGSRITKASDDAAGLAISTKISSDVSALEQASTNASHGISILQTADGGAANVSDILERMKTLASQAASATVTDTERTYIQAEFSQLLEEVDGISTSTRYNGQSLLDGTSSFAMETDDTAASLTGTYSSAEDAVLTASGTAAELVSSSAGFTLEDGNSVSFDVNGTTVSLAASGADVVYDAASLADEINAALTADGNTDVAASLDDDGELVFTSTDTGSAASITVDNFTGTVDGSASLALADVGLSTGTASGADSGFTLADGETVSFDVNGTTVTLSNDTGSDVDYGGAELATAINDALTADDNTAVTASTDADGNLVLTSETADVSVDNFTGTLAATDIAASDLGLADTTAELETTFFTLGDEQSVSFDVNGTTVTLANDTGADVSYDAESLATAINAALTADGNTAVSAAADDDGGLVFTSTATGRQAEVEIDGFTGTLDGSTDLAATDLGLTATLAKGTTTQTDTSGSTVVVGSDASDTISLAIASLTAEDLGIESLNISTQDGAEAALSALDTAIDTVSNARAEMGATMSRFEFRSAQIDTSVENLEAAESAIADVDIASEQAKLSAASVKVQAAVAAASQANEMPQNLLSLLR